MREKKCLHKGLYLDQQNILILGGASFPVEVFNHVIGKSNQYHPVINIFNEYIRKFELVKDFKKYLIV